MRAMPDDPNRNGASAPEDEELREDEVLREDALDDRVEEEELPGDSDED